MASDSASAAFGGTRSLGPLTIARWRGRQFADFEEFVRDARAAAARKSVEQSRLGDVERERIIADVRAQPVTNADLYDFLHSDSGFRHGILLAAQAHDPKARRADVDKGDFPRGQMLELILWMLGYDAIKPKEPGTMPKEGEALDDDDPPPPCATG